jgi:hypothetical protein
VCVLARLSVSINSKQAYRSLLSIACVCPTPNCFGGLPLIERNCQKCVEHINGGFAFINHELTFCAVGSDDIKAIPTSLTVNSKQGAFFVSAFLHLELV